MRMVRRLLVVWVAGLLVAGAGSVAAMGGEEASRVVAGAGAGGAEPAVAAEVEGTLLEASPSTSAASPAAAAGTSAAAASSSSSSKAEFPTSTVAAPPATIHPPVMTPGTVLGPPGGTPLPDPRLAVPCTVQVDPTKTSVLGTGEAQAGGWSSGPLVIGNCRPVVGDEVSVTARNFSPWGALQVDFGDGSFAGVETSGCPIMANQVEDHVHRYAKPGRYVLRSTTRFPCTPDPPVVHWTEIVVSAGRVPAAAGAAPCRGVGPVGPGEPARQGIGKRPVDTVIGPLDVLLVRCSTALGQKSEIHLWWYQVVAVVDWGDGTTPERIGGKGLQGASSIHVSTKRGLQVVTVWVLEANGTPGNPLTFTLLVS